MDIIRRPLSYFMPYCSDYCSDYYYNFRGRFNNVSVNYKPNNNINDAENMDNVELQDVLEINIPEFGPIPSDYILVTVKHIDNVMTDDDIKTMHQGWEIIEHPDEINDKEIDIES